MSKKFEVLHPNKTFEILHPLVTTSLFRRLMISLLVIDVIFLGAHVAAVLLQKFEMQKLSFLPVDLKSIRIDVEGSFSEAYEHMKAAACVAAFFIVYWKRAKPVYILFAGVFFAAILDNSLQAHEAAGSTLTPWSAAGELLAFTSSGAIFLSLLWLFWPQTGPDAAYVTACTLLLSGLAFFAVVVDAVHYLVPLYVDHTEQLLGFVEDGGELLALTFNVAFVCTLARYATSGGGEGETMK